ncbi:hypothetical protein MVEN_00751300 [Mycena venus]|uniref:HMG box domain-containing protein n=1 Tax=Mycena venus TaxID=2733690 RepID=A0A8H6YFI2_9AGAR|nr:hypothetical protein MVEN_00751300 [Mycena venus]
MPVHRTSPRIPRKTQAQKPVGCKYGRPAASTNASSSADFTGPVADGQTRRRTPNSFFCFRSWILKEGLLEGTTNSQSELSKMIADEWAKLAPQQKRPFEEMAEALKLAPECERGSNMTPVGEIALIFMSLAISKSKSISRRKNKLQDCTRPASCDGMEPQFATVNQPASNDRFESPITDTEAAFMPADLEVSGLGHPSLVTGTDVVIDLKGKDNYYGPCETKSKTISMSGGFDTLTLVRPAYHEGLETQFVTDNRPASHDRIDPQFAGAVAAKPILSPALLEASSSSGTYYSSLDTGFADMISYHICSDPDPRPTFRSSNDLEDGSGKKQGKAEDSEPEDQWKKYFNLDGFED